MNQELGLGIDTDNSVYDVQSCLLGQELILCQSKKFLGQMNQELSLGMDTDKSVYAVQSCLHRSIHLFGS